MKHLDTHVLSADKHEEQKHEEKKLEEHRWRIHCVHLVFGIV